MESLAVPLSPLLVPGVLGVTLSRRHRLCRCLCLPPIFLCYVVWLCFTTSCRRAFERNLRSPARCTSFACSFHAVSSRPGLVKLLALSNFQARRRSPRDSSFTGHFGQLFVISLCHRCFLPYDRMRALVTGISNPMTALRQSSSSSSAPSMTWLRNGLLVFDALDLGGIICVWIWLIRSLVSPLKMNVFVFLTSLDLSVSCRISWLKGKRPGTRTLAACRQKRTSADKTQQLEQARSNALAGRGNEQRWQPLLQCEHFVSYVWSDLSTDPERPWIVGASTMAPYFSRSFLRYGIMGNWHGAACAGWICFTGKMLALLVMLLVWLCILITFSESHCWTTVQKLMILVKRWTMKNVSLLISVDSARYGLKAQPPSIPVSIKCLFLCCLEGCLSAIPGMIMAEEIEAVGLGQFNKI